MFSLYGISGPIFQGTLENLSRQQPVRRRGLVQAARRIDDQVETEEALPAAQNTPARHALEAYQAMLPQDLERGPLYHANHWPQSRARAQAGLRRHAARGKASGRWISRSSPSRPGRRAQRRASHKRAGC